MKTLQFLFYIAETKEAFTNFHTLWNQALTITIKFIVIAFLIGVCFSCSDDNEFSQEQEAVISSQMFSEIESLKYSVDCENSLEWTYSSYRSKSCEDQLVL